MRRSTLWSELIHVHVPPAPPEPPSLQPAIQHLWRGTSNLCQRAFRAGVLNQAEVEDVLTGLEKLDLVVKDIEGRLGKAGSLREQQFNRTDIVSLKFIWKKELRTFLRFNDTLRDAVNCMLVNGSISLKTADEIKRIGDLVYGFFLEVDAAVLALLR